MADLATNLLSGLMGALVGALTGIYAVRHSHELQAEAALRVLLVAQRIEIRILDSEAASKKLEYDFLAAFQAYQNLRSLAMLIRWKSLDAAWRKYKGNLEDAMPLFGEQAVKCNGPSTTVTARSFTRDEIMDKIERFLKCVG